MCEVDKDDNGRVMMITEHRVYETNKNRKKI